MKFLTNILLAFWMIAILHSVGLTIMDAKFWLIIFIGYAMGMNLMLDD